MRASVIGIAVVAIGWGTGGVAAEPLRAARSVQVISMGPMSSPKQPSTADNEAPQAADHPGSRALPPAFRVHDLSRRWVELQMADSFSADPEAPMRTDGGDPFAYVGAEQPSVPRFTAAVPAAGSISVPLWMRGGAIFASAASRYVPECSAAPYRPTGFLRSDAEFRRATYYGLMSNIACEHGIPVGLFDAVIIRESRYQPNIYSPKNAFGLTQLMPGTAAQLGVDRYHVESNLRGGAKYLRQQIDRFGHYHLALAAYNAGPGRVRNGAVPRIRETQDYVDNVLLNWSRLSGFQRRATIVPQATVGPVTAARPVGRSAIVSTF